MKNIARFGLARWGLFGLILTTVLSVNTASLAAPPAPLTEGRNCPAGFIAVQRLGHTICSRAARPNASYRRPTRLPTSFADNRARNDRLLARAPFTTGNGGSRQVLVDAPFTNVNVGNQVSVRAPFTNVNVGQNNPGSVSAPFTDVNLANRQVMVNAPFTNVGVTNNRVTIDVPFFSGSFDIPAGMN